MICDLRSRLPLPLLCAIRDCHCFRECLRDSRLAIVDASAIRDLRMRLPSSVIFGPMRGGFLRLHFFGFFNFRALRAAFSTFSIVHFSIFGPCGRLFRDSKFSIFDFSGPAGGFTKNSNCSIFVFGPCGATAKKGGGKTRRFDPKWRIAARRGGDRGTPLFEVKKSFLKILHKGNFFTFFGEFSVTQACPIPPPNSTAFDSTRPLPTFPHPSRRLEKFLNLGNRHKK